jgi:hypothetical protein
LAASTNQPVFNNQAVVRSQAAARGRTRVVAVAVRDRNPAAEAAVEADIQAAEAAFVGVAR